MNKITTKKISKDYQENKNEWDEMLNSERDAKIDSCTIKDKFGEGKNGFDYIKMAEMHHSGKW
jgi:uncharacterized surface anchored protein